MTRIRVGVLSFAHDHAVFWSEAFRRDPAADLAGIWDDDVNRGEAAAQRHGCPFEPDLERLLDRVDAVAITSETAWHPALVERASARGKAILCEKPIAVDLAGLDAIEAAVAAAGVPFMQSFPKRFDPVNAELKALVDSGRLGRIWLARIRHGHGHGRDEAFRTGWWTDRSRSGGGTLLDEGIHAADFLCWFFGRPESVQTTVSNAVLGTEVEDGAVAVFRWAGGLIGEIAAGWNFAAADVSVEMYGTDGTGLLAGVDLASRDRAGPGALRHRSRGDAAWISSPTVPGFASGGFHHEVAHRFIHCLATRERPPVGLSEARAALELIVAANRSARLGRAVPLDEVSFPTGRHRR